MSKRRNFTSKFKSKVAIEALQERLSAQEIAQKYQIHPNQVQKWKREFLDNAEQVFEKDSTKKKTAAEKEQQELYKKIGQLQVEVDFLKNALS
jgi:transposase